MSCDRVYCRVQSGGTDTFVCNCLCHQEKPKDEDPVEEITRCNRCLDHLIDGECPKKFAPCKDLPAGFEVDYTKFGEEPEVKFCATCCCSPCVCNYKPKE